MRTLIVGVVVWIGLVSTAWTASVTVAKPPTTADYTTVQAGIAAAGLMGTVTILDSQTYVEDITIVAPANAFVTIRAAAGQRPTIRAANGINRYAALGIVTNDHFGMAVTAPCTLIGLNIENLDPVCNKYQIPPMPAPDDLGASAMIVNSPSVTVRNCRINGPGGTFGAGDWAVCLVVALSATPAAVTLENCEIYGGEYGAVDETFAEASGSPLPDSTIVLNDCDIHNNTASGVQIDAGVTTATRCIIRNNDTGIGAGGGRLFLIGCNVRDNTNQGMDIDFNASFAHPGDSCRVKATDCLFWHNGSGESSIDLRDGSLNIDHSIIGLGDNGGVWMGGDDPATALLQMNYCDVYAPGKTCILFDTGAAFPANASIKNSILVGGNGVMCQTGHRANIYSSNIFVTGTRLQNTQTSNTITADPLYDAPTSGRRDGYYYHNFQMQAGEGTSWIGSQGRWRLAARRSWVLYR